MILFAIPAVAIVVLEKARTYAVRQAREGHPRALHVLQAYSAARAWVLDHKLVTLLGLLSIIVFLGLFFRGLRALSAATGRWRERAVGMAFRGESYALERPPFSLRSLLVGNPKPADLVVLGVDAGGKTVTMSTRDRSMHIHVLGQTGSGKTKSVIEPLLFQDVWHRRSALVIDGKASEENECRLIGMAARAGRLDEVRIFTLNPTRRTHTYNPVHLTPGADPVAVAERIFSTFADDMEHGYFRNQAHSFFTALVRVLASTGKRFTMLDLAAAIASRDVLSFALSQGDDVPARRSIESQFRELAKDVGKTFTGLLAAVRRYNSPALNAYEPDIVLEDDIEAGRILGFFLPVNLYKQLARYVGICVLQHLQQVGALRQLDRSRSQRPIYVYADEFYSFAYDGFTDSLNKLRDANVSLLLAHQTFSDLERVSPEFASGVWGNTRNKIMLYQSDPDVCERLSKTLGTKKEVELTVRRSADQWLNSVSALEASTKEVDAYRLHPNRIKALKCGQGYLAQDSDFFGVNFGQVPELPAAELPPRAPAGASNGIGLHDLFVNGPRVVPAAGAGS
jgi:hypothetical protein